MIRSGFFTVHRIWLQSIGQNGACTSVILLVDSTTDSRYYSPALVIDDNNISSSHCDRKTMVGVGRLPQQRSKGERVAAFVHFIVPTLLPLVFVVPPFNQNSPCSQQIKCYWIAEYLLLKAPPLLLTRYYCNICEHPLANIHTFTYVTNCMEHWNKVLLQFQSFFVLVGIHSKFTIIELVLITGKDGSRNRAVCYFMSNGENLFYYVVLRDVTLIKQI